MKVAFVLSMVFMVAWSAELRDEERLIGWRGDSYNPRQKDLKTWVQVIAWHPRATIIHNLISEEEAQHIAEQAWPRMQRSTVVGPNGSSVLDNYRTSYGTFLNRYETPVLARIQDRVALLTKAPVQHQEDMQVLRYGIGQYYHKHTDSLANDQAGPRMATILIYLADAEEGGETSFPDGSEWSDPKLEQVYGPQLSECAKGKVAFRPRRGDALLFYSIDPNGKTEDMHSMHEGCPVIKGAKWTTTIWVHTRPFRPEQWNGHTFTLGKPDDEDPGVCLDGNKECKVWAAAGECKKNEQYMSRVCAQTCKVCEPCTVKDKETREPCFWRNREAQNYLVFEPKELTFNVKN